MTRYPLELLKERFLAKVRVTDFHEDDCWDWTANIVTGRWHKPYGLMRTGRRKSELAHRVSFQIYRGEIPSGLLVCHTCDCPLCVNPNHLFLGTSHDNMQDCISKGRHTAPFGDQVGTSKLTNSQVLSIIVEKSNGSTVKQLALKYSVTRTAIFYILNGRAWNRITGIPKLKGPKPKGKYAASTIGLAS